ncbi:SDR family NAD(P)-dependent oxidoreductase [Stagnimonas aquatica]|uniref:SDR family NAD(P)-dependent oxidoreductase n=1 Tax=Stagnimonas aquatica TaxID=2689987 RepID=A0A3N0VL86_9GAMM|nr:oxidoreductase [Stagnimonas aquatica]ROH93471.1 SDR family NAD(P)-dependent oxidoreductase [Stagnimonas aquatica]
MSHTAWTRAHLPSLAGRQAIVTGANSGLGLETAVGLAAAGAHLVLACRSPERSSAALAELRRRVPGASAELMRLDLSDLASVRAFADQYGGRRLDILVNNAGVMALPYATTKDGFELQIGTNHLGHFALTGLLLPRLLATPGARVVTVASIAHRAASGFALDDLHWQQRPYNKAQAYACSKLANLLFSLELDRRLRAAGHGLIAVAAHPGYAATNIGLNTADGERNALEKLAIRIGNALFAQSAAGGALPSLRAAGDPAVRGGEYYGPRGLFQFVGAPVKVGHHPRAGDPELARRLWQQSEQVTGLRYL